MPQPIIAELDEYDRITCLRLSPSGQDASEWIKRNLQDDERVDCVVAGHGGAYSVYRHLSVTPRDFQAPPELFLGNYTLLLGEVNVNVIDFDYKRQIEVYPRVTLGSNVTLHSSVTIQNGSTVGKATELFPGVSVGQGCHIGERNTFHYRASTGNSVITGEGCVLGIGASLGHRVALGAYSTVSEEMGVPDDVTLAYGTNL